MPIDHIIVALLPVGCYLAVLLTVQTIVMVRRSK